METQLGRILALILFIFGHSIIAQELVISGKVSDQHGIPLQSVNIIIKATDRGAQTDFEFKDVFIGTDQQPWTDYLTLFVMDGAESDNVLFSANPVSGEQKLNIGKGEIGVCKLLIRPGYFSKSGNMQFKLIYQDPVADKNLFAETSITLQDNLADIRQQTCSEGEYLLATNKTQQALELAIQTVKKWPESYNERVLLGSVYEKNDQPDEALRAYRYSLGLFKSEEPGQLTESPIGLYQKIKVLEAKLGKKE